MANSGAKNLDAPGQDKDEENEDRSRVIVLTGGVKYNDPAEILKRGVQAKAMGILSLGKWSPELSKYASRTLVDYIYTEEAVIQMEKKLDFLQENVPPALFKNPSLGLTNLFFADIRYLEALMQYLGESEWLKVLNDPKKCSNFSDAYLGSARLPLEWDHYEDFAKRSSVGTMAEGGTAVTVDELNDVLTSTGIDELAIPILDKITLGPPSSTHQAHGVWRFKSSEIRLEIGPEVKFALLPVLLHEVGHAFGDRVAWDDKSCEIFYRYIILTQFEPTVNSPYAMSHELSDEFKAPEDRTKFVSESFAEDFRLFWLKPELLSSGKLAVLEELCDIFYPKINRDELRKKIRSVLGNYYGKSTDEAIDSHGEFTPKEYAIYMDQQRAKKKDSGRAS